VGFIENYQALEFNVLFEVKYIKLQHFMEMGLFIDKL